MAYANSMGPARLKYQKASGTMGKTAGSLARDPLHDENASRTAVCAEKPTASQAFRAGVRPTRPQLWTAAVAC